MTRDTLNPAQRQAVQYTDGPCLVLAGAGSGKTRVITEKIHHLVTNRHIAPNQIYAVTFTNKAAREMRERVGKRLKEGAKDVNISTFHTLGLSIIRHSHKELGLNAQFTLFDDQDCAALIQALAGDNKLDKGEIMQIQQSISRYKNQQITPAVALDQAKNPREALIARLYERYLQQMKSYQAVDFDDLIVLPLQLFQAKPEALTLWQGKVRYLLVDEYQDTNAAQYQLVKYLVQFRQQFTVVGDDDQSIYAWRGAQPENLSLLQCDFPKLTVIKLEQNYRSTGIILQAANQLIRNNPHVFDKQLQATQGYGEPIKVLFTPDAEAEADRVVASIMQHQFQHRTEHKDYAILYRGNHQAMLLEKALRQYKVPYHLSGGTSFFARQEIKDIIAYCRLLANTTDDAAFIRIINTPKREIGPTTLKKLGDYAKQRHVSLFKAINEIGLTQQLPAASENKLRQFADWIQGLQAQLNQKPADAVLKQLVDDSDYYVWLESQSSQQKTADNKQQYVEALIQWIRQLMQESPERTFATLIQTLLLLDRQEDDTTGNKVQLMTLHASKGLEFPHVFLVGFEEKILPHQNSIETDSIEEERRLAYVGITRAEKTLTITLAQKRNRFGEALVCQPSRFLAELPESILKIEGRDAINETEQKQLNRDKVAALKAMFKAG
jgi:ATP-dependent DNA helicase Rep